MRMTNDEGKASGPRLDCNGEPLNRPFRIPMNGITQEMVDQLRREQELTQEEIEDPEENYCAHCFARVGQRFEVIGGKRYHPACWEKVAFPENDPAE